MNQELHQQVTPYIDELGRRDALTDTLAGTRDRYATYLALYSGGTLSVSNWQAYRAAYEAERERILQESSASA